MFFEKVLEVDVSEAVKELEGHPELWGKYSLRKSSYVHTMMTDIWVRYNDIKNIGPQFNDEHESAWYPDAELIPNIKKIAFELMNKLEGTRLGGILITKLPPGGRIEPHVDRGWHAGYYEKFYVALQNHPGSVFCWEGQEINARSGEVYWFRNDVPHWVENNSDKDRISLIVCMRRT